MLVRLWSRRNSYTVMVGGCSITTMKNSVAIPQKSKIRATMWSTLLILGLYPKEMNAALRRWWAIVFAWYWHWTSSASRCFKESLDMSRSLLSAFLESKLVTMWMKAYLRWPKWWDKNACPCVRNISLICSDPGSQRPETLGSPCVLCPALEPLWRGLSRGGETCCCCYYCCEL